MIKCCNQMFHNSTTERVQKGLFDYFYRHHKEDLDCKFQMPRRTNWIQPEINFQSAVTSSQEAFKVITEVQANSVYLTEQIGTAAHENEIKSSKAKKNKRNLVNPSKMPLLL